MNAKTFRDLVEEKAPLYSDVVATFDEYAHSGAAISYPAVKKVINNADLSIPQLEEVYTSLEYGMVSQAKRGHGPSAVEYFQAMNYVAKQLANLGVLPSDLLLGNTLDEMAAQLIAGHAFGQEPILEWALDTFQIYMAEAKPTEFSKDSLVVTGLVGPGPLYIGPSSMRLDGRDISKHNYLQALGFNENHEVVEWKNEKK